MTNDQFERLANAKAQLTQARKAFAQNPSPALSRSIHQLQGFIRRNSIGRYNVEFTDTFGGEANYCWVQRFSVKASSIRGASIVAARHLGYSGRIRKTADYGDQTRHDVSGAALCFFISWHDEDSPSVDNFPLVN